ncbi:MAG: hypothetical protein OXE43_02650 [Chloroflexi bacterium]|nr:hypothetical protein [Chloroflexota bacterium]
MASQPAGQLFDIGYQRYDGPRQGRNRARLALFVGGVRHTLGLGRGGRSKILPVLMVLVSVVPAAVILVLAAIGGGIIDRPVELGDYFPINSLLLLIISGILGPTLLIPDRTDNVLSLYLVRPLGMLDYLAARWFAFFLVTSLIVLAGPLILLCGYILLSADAAQELRDNWLDFPKVLLGAAALGAFIASIPLGVAAFAPRRVYAAAFVIGVVLVGPTVVGILTEPIDFDGSSFQQTVERPITEEEIAEADQFIDATRSLPGDAETIINVEFDSGESRQYLMSRNDVEEALEGGNVTTFESDEPKSLLDPEIGKWVIFTDPTGATVFVTDLLFEDVQSNNYRQLVARHPDYYPVAAYLAWVLIPLALMWWRYRRYTA